MTHNDYITDAIELQDKDHVIDGVLTQNNLKTLMVSKPKNKTNKCCIYCGSVSIKIHGYNKRKIKFLDIASYKTIIEYKQRRFKCNDGEKNLI